MNLWKRFATTAAFASCFPLIAPSNDPDSMKGLSKYLPSVGLLIGLILIGISLLLNFLHANMILGGTLITLAWITTTGGIHYDGLMDAADGIFSHRDPQRMLEIMTDSRVGNFGAVMGFGNILLKVACLSSMSFPSILLILLIVPVWARWCQTFTIGAFPYLRQAGMGKIWHETTKFPADAYLATALPLLLTTVVASFNWKIAAVATVATVVAGIWIAYRIKSILGGHTGDTYGAVVELSETGGLLVLALTNSFWIC